MFNINISFLKKLFHTLIEIHLFDIFCPSIEFLDFQKHLRIFGDKINISKYLNGSIFILTHREFLINFK